MNATIVSAGTIRCASRLPALDVVHVWADRLLVGLLLVSCLLIPLLFNTHQDDVFALPKVTAARAIVLMGLMAAAAALGRTRLRWSAIDLAALAFVALNALAFANSVDREQSLNGERLQYQGMFTILTYVGVFYLARLALSDGRRLALLAGCLVAGATCVAAYALVQKAGADPLWDYLPDGRVFSTLGQANALGAYLAMALCIAVSLFLVTLRELQGLGRTFVCAGLAAVVVMIALALVFTFSRGAFLALAVCAGAGGLWLVGTTIRPTRIVVLAGALGVVIAAIFLVTLRNDIGQGWHFGRSEDTAQESTHMHVALWKIGVTIANDNPALGAGQETFPLLVPSYRDDVLSAEAAADVARYRPESPHNVYIAMAAGSGYPALIAYVAMITLACWPVVRAIQRDRAKRPHSILLMGVLGAIGVHLVADFFMTAEVTGSWLFWLLLGAGFAVSRVESADEAG
jgi:O-antigen ligase